MNLTSARNLGRRKISVAMLLATIALGAGAQAIGPAGAAAMISNGAQCLAVAGAHEQWRTSTGQICILLDSGEVVPLATVSGGGLFPVSGEAPQPPQGCVSNCLPDQIGPGGRTQGAEKETGHDPKIGGATGPSEAAEAKKSEKCFGWLSEMDRLVDRNSKLRKSIAQIARIMSNGDEDQRVKLVVELERNLAEIKSLAKVRRDNRCRLVAREIKGRY